MTKKKDKHEALGDCKTTRMFLPFPPSVNGLFSGKARRFKSDAYKTWLKAAKVEFDAQMEYDKIMAGFSYEGINHKGSVNLTFLFKAPDKRKRDLDNLLKAGIDFIVSQGVIAGDDSRYVRSIYAEWSDLPSQAGMFICVTDDN